MLESISERVRLMVNSRERYLEVASGAKVGSGSGPESAQCSIMVMDRANSRIRPRVGGTRKARIWAGIEAGIMAGTVN